MTQRASTEAMKLNSARLTMENYSPSRGGTCPLCGEDRVDEYGSVRWYIPIDEQKFVGWADAPFVRPLSNPKYKEVGAGFECKHCFKLYWFHLSFSHVEDLCEWAAEAGKGEG